MKDWLKLNISSSRPFSSDEGRKKWLDHSKSGIKGKSEGNLSKEGEGGESKNKFLPFRGSVRKKIQEFEANKEKNDDEKKPFKPKHTSGLERLIESVDSLADEVTWANSSQSSFLLPPSSSADKSYLPKDQRCTGSQVPPQDAERAPLNYQEPRREQDFKFDESSGNDGESYPGGSQPEKMTREEEKNGEEALYVSRKLLVRQLIEEELKNSVENLSSDLEQPDDDKSLADSWSEIEENFTRIYEPVPPIPFDVRMTSWRQMSKKQILAKVSSKRLVEELKPLPRRDILEKIEQVKSLAFVSRQMNDYYPEPNNQAHKIQVVAQVHRDDSKGSLGDTSSGEREGRKESYDNDDDSSRLELYKSIRELDECLDSHIQHESDDDTTSWKSVPTNDDIDEQVYVSRSEILSRHDPIYSSRPEAEKGRGFHPIYESQVESPQIIHLPFPPVSRKAIISNATRESYLVETLSRQMKELSGKSTSFYTRSDVISHLMQIRGPSSAKTYRDVHSYTESDFQGKGREIEVTQQRPGSPSSICSLDSGSWDLRKVYQPVSNKSDADNMRQSSGVDDEEELIAKQTNLYEMNRKRVGKRSDYKDSWSFSEGEEFIGNEQKLSRAEILNKGMRLRESPALELQRRVEEILSMHDHIETPTKEKVMNILREHIKNNCNVDSLADAEKKNREMRDQLKETLAKDWETLSNINLGFIYVPMEESTKHVSKLPSKESTDYDTFGSLDSLIFEPKSLSKDDHRLDTSEIRQESDIDCIKKRQVNALDTQTNESFVEKAVGGGGDYSYSHSFKGELLNDFKEKISDQKVENERDETNAQEGISCKEIDKRNSCKQPQETTASFYASSIGKENKPLIKEDVNGKVEAPTKKKMLWVRLQKGITSGLFRSGSKNNEFTNTKGTRSSQQSNKPQCPSVSDSNSYSDVTKKLSSISGNTSSLESTSVESDTESITSIESVIVNSKFKLKEIDEEKKKKQNLSQKYVVNQCTESDSSSEQDKSSQCNSSGQNVLDSDTSWDYIDPQKALEMRRANLEEKGVEDCKTGLDANEKNNPGYENINLLMQEAQQSTSESDESLRENSGNVKCSETKNASNQVGFFSASHTTPIFPDSDSESLYEECAAILNPNNASSIALLKHHVYQSLDSASHSKPGKDASDEISGFDQARHEEVIYGTGNSRIFKSMNGVYVDQNIHERPPDEDPLVMRNGEMVPLTEEVFYGTNERKKNDGRSQPPPGDRTLDGHKLKTETETTTTTTTTDEDSTRDSLGSSEIFEKPTDVETVSTSSGTETDDKIKKVQRFGISLMGNNNSDLMIRELKLKLKNRFNVDEKLEENNCRTPKYKPISPSSVLNPSNKDGGASSVVASKREQLAPHMSKIFNSFHVKKKELETANGDASKDEITTPEDSKERKQELNELTKEQKIEEVLVAEIGDSIIWIPTPDYTPLSTLHRKREAEAPFLFAASDDGTFDGSHLEKFVHVHLRGAASHPAKTLESALLTDDRRAGRVRTGSSKRSVRFDTSDPPPETSLGATWSDLESIIFAEDRSFSSEVFEHGGRTSSPLTDSSEATLVLKGPESRMESYKDDWLLWDQLVKMRNSTAPEDRERWHTEKTKRMLLWIHLSNNDEQREWCYKSHWWKVSWSF